MKIKTDKADSKELCRLALKLYEENTDESKRELLKDNLQAVYEAVPKNRRKYILGDMDVHDSPIRDIIYGEHNMVNWDYRQYITDNGELYLPNFGDLLSQAKELSRIDKEMTIPKLMKHFKISYARAADLLKNTKR